MLINKQTIVDRSYHNCKLIMKVSPGKGYEYYSNFLSRGSQNQFSEQFTAGDDERLTLIDIFP